MQHPGDAPSRARLRVPPSLPLLFTAVVAASCGGGDNIPIAEAPAAAFGPAVPAPPPPTPAPTAAPSPAPTSAPAPAPTTAPAPAPTAAPAPAPTAAPAPAPAPAGGIAASFTAVVFADGPQAGATSLNDAGQVAYTATTATGDRPRFFDGSAVRDITTEAGRAIAVNASGEVTGYVLRTSRNLFTWSPAAPQVLTVVDQGPAIAIVPAAINAGGQVAGTSSNRGFFTAFRREPDGTGESLVPIGATTLTGAPTHALFINTAGTVAGSSATPAGSTHVALWPMGQAVVDVGTLGGANSSVAALNDAGQVAGQADLANGEQHAFRWSAASGIADLGTLGGTTSDASSMNASGWVAGSATTADGHTLATLWQGTTPLSLGTLGGTDSAATVVNAAGQVAGHAKAADGTLHAFVWSVQDGMVDLNARVGSADLGVLQDVVALAQDGSVLSTTDRGTLVLLRPAP